MPLAGATVLVWVVKLVALGLLFYAAFWLALVLLVGVAAAWTASNSTVDDDRWTQPDELRNGEAGFGLYSSSGPRIDPPDPKATTAERRVGTEFGSKCRSRRYPNHLKKKKTMTI